MRVAIVGSGFSGLSALWLLKQYSPHEVNIYERDWRPGGQFQCVELRPNGKAPCWVDVGFLGYDPKTSPNFDFFLRLLGLPTQTSTIKLDEALRRAGSLSHLSSWDLAFEAVRFNLLAPTAPDVTLEEYLKKEGYSTAFFEEYLLPRIAQKWIVPDDLTALSLPVSKVIDLHAPTETIEGGAKAVIDTICSIIPPENLHLNTEIASVESVPEGVALTESGGRRHIYDHVILAVPGDVALEMLKRGGRVTPYEERLLSQADYKPISVSLMQSKNVSESGRNGTVEYSTTSAPPSYNGNGQSTQQVTLNFDMTTIEHLDEDAGQVNVVYNGTEPGQYKFDYRVPVPRVQTPDVAEAQANGGDEAPQSSRHISLLPNRGHVESNLVASYNLVTSPPFSANQPWPLISNPPKPATTALRTTRAGVRLVSWVKGWIAYWLRFHVRGWNGVFGGVWRVMSRLFGGRAQAA